MAHTYTNLLFHIVFSTDGHVKLLTKDRRSELFAYIATLVKEKGGRTIIMNGVEDHVHMLIELPPNVAVSDVLRFVKANSSRWFKERFGVRFGWQRGFGAFSVSRSGAKAVARYIEDQERHHQRRDFRSEILMLLEKNEVEFDEEYLWR